MEEREYSSEELKLLKIENGFSWFTAIEDKLKEIFKYLPPVEENKNVYSGINAALINEACSILDSLFKYIIGSDECKEIPNVEKYREKVRKNRINISDYRNLFENRWKLSKKKVFLTMNKRAYRPFLEFEGGESPSWWNNYQLIKHNRFDSTERATLDSSIQSVMAVFLVMCISNTFQKLLYRNGMLKSGIPVDYWGRQGDFFDDKTSDSFLLYVSRNFLFTPTRTLQDKNYEDIFSQIVDEGIMRA